MKVGILKPFRGTYKSMLDVYKQILDYNNIEYIDLDINDVYFWEQVKQCNLFLAKFSQIDDDLHLLQEILPTINLFLKIPCFPDYNTAWHYDDKIKQYYLLSSFGFPVVESYIFWDKRKAFSWLETASLPIVFKLKGGSGSSNVTLVQNRHTARNLIRKSFNRGINPYWYDPIGKLKAFNWNTKKILKYILKPYYRKYIKGENAYSNYIKQKNYVYFQKYLPNNEYDTRVAIVGKRAWAFKRFNRKNDFRASGSNNYDTRKDLIDKEMIRIAFEVSRTFGFQSMAYDFVYDENKRPIIIEISYTYGDYPEFSTGYFDEELNWYDGKYVPEYLELLDALNLPNLKQPEIELNSPYKSAKMQ